MTSAAIAPQPFSQRLLASWRRFFRWLTSPHVILSIIMLVLIFYMVIIPLYRMITTTITYADNDRRYAKDAVPGELHVLPLDENANHPNWDRDDAGTVAPLVDDITGSDVHGICHRRRACLAGRPHGLAW